MSPYTNGEFDIPIAYFLANVLVVAGAVTWHHSVLSRVHSPKRRACVRASMPGMMGVFAFALLYFTTSMPTRAWLGEQGTLLVQSLRDGFHDGHSGKLPRTDRMAASRR